jgi:hypothetical protein
MWNVEPSRICNRHLLGEHVEMHMFVGAINKGKRISGYVSRGLVETENLEKRHNALASEMQRRGMNHKSPLSQPKISKMGVVDVIESERELRRRCNLCAHYLRRT